MGQQNWDKSSAFVIASIQVTETKFKVANKFKRTTNTKELLIVKTTNRM